MNNKRIDLIFAILVIAFLIVAIMLISETNARRIKGYEQSTIAINNIVRQKNSKIKSLYTQLVLAEQENTDLKNTLSDTRNALESLSKKLAQPVLIPAPAAAKQ